MAIITIHMDMDKSLTPSAMLGMLRLSSPVLPVGAFSYSEGVESAFEQGWIKDESTAQNWICDAMELNVIRCDWPYLDRLMQAWAVSDFETVHALNHQYLMTRETKEIRQQSLQMGHSMINWIDNHPLKFPDLRASLDRSCTAWIVALSLAHFEHESPLWAVRLSHAFSWLENQVQAAMKATPLGQQAGQRISQAMIQVLIQKHNQYEQLISVPEPISFSPGFAILSSQHEHQYSRIFRS